MSMFSARGSFTGGSIRAVGLAVVAFLALQTNVRGAPQANVGDYDFAYMSAGDARLKPVQIFDDGKSTWFQFKPGAPVPTIFGTKDGKPQLLVPSFEGSYVKVAQISGRYTLAYEKGQITVVYSGSGRADAPAINAVASNGMTAPFRGHIPADPAVKLVATVQPPAVQPNTDLRANSYATPLKGDKVVWKESEVEVTEFPVYFTKGSAVLSAAGKKAVTLLAESAKKSSGVTVVGRDDDSMKENLDIARGKALKTALVAAGVNEEKISLKTGLKKEPKGKLWASEVRIEQLVATQISRPEPTGTQSEAQRAAYVKSNVDRMVALGLVSKDQAASLLANGRQLGGSNEVPPDGFDFRASDQKVSNTVRRWASSTNYQVVWEVPPEADAQVTGDLQIQAASMREAVERVVVGLKKKGYDMQATFYSNRVIRFTGVSK